MIDLSTITKGDKVKFRCGVELEVSFIDVKESEYSYKYGLCYEGYLLSGSFFDAERYQSGGSLHGTAVKHPFDITSIIPAPFDWADVKQGMAFDSPTKHVRYYFIGKDSLYQGANPCFVFRVYPSRDEMDFSFKHYYLHELEKASITRSPDKDILL